MQHVSMKKTVDHTKLFNGFLGAERTLKGLLTKTMTDAERALARAAHAVTASALDFLAEYGNVEEGTAVLWTSTGQHDAFEDAKAEFVKLNALHKSLKGVMGEAAVEKALALVASHTTYVGDPRTVKAA